MWQPTSLSIFQYFHVYYNFKINIKSTLIIIITANMRKDILVMIIFQFLCLLSNWRSCVYFWAGTMELVHKLSTPPLSSCYYFVNDTFLPHSKLHPTQQLQIYNVLAKIMPHFHKTVYEIKLCYNSLTWEVCMMKLMEKQIRGHWPIILSRLSKTKKVSEVCNQQKY